MALPNFAVKAALPVDLALTFEGFALYSLLVSDWNGAAWVTRSPALASNESSHAGGPAPVYALGTVPLGTTILVTSPIAMTSPSGDTAVSAVYALTQSGASVGSVTTPTATPAPDEQASNVIRFYLTGV